MKFFIPSALIAGLALMGGVAHAQSTPTSAVDINVDVGATCSLTSKAVYVIPPTNSPIPSSDDSFFQVRCNQGLAHKLVLSGPSFSSPDNIARLILENENGTEEPVGVRMATTMNGSHYTQTYNSNVTTWNYTGTGQTVNLGFGIHSNLVFRGVEIGTYTANVTATIEY